MLFLFPLYFHGMIMKLLKFHGMIWVVIYQVSVAEDGLCFVENYL